MLQLLDKLAGAYPHLSFKPGEHFCWSPEHSEVFYKASGGRKARWTLLHETGHALLGHDNYCADFELLRLEAEAWQKARELGSKFGLAIDEDHIQDCLDTYRDWLYKRSICPDCGTKCLQQDDYLHYSCFNCHKVWRVSSNRFARTYRSTKNVTQPTTFYACSDISS